MDYNKNRLAIASVALVVLVGGLYFGIKSRDEALTDSAAETPSLPNITADAIREIAITRPGQPTVRLVKQGDTFRVAAPVQAATDTGVVNTAIEKLTGLEFVTVAATNVANHATLEVDDAHAIRVVLTGASGPLADLRVGAFRGGNTMIRVGTSNDVIAVRGSIKFAFNRELREWRDRTVVDADATNVRAISIVNELGTYAFERNASDEWVQSAGQTPIERFSGQKVETLVAALAHLRANDFAADGATTGLATPSSTVTLTVRTGGGEADAGVAATTEQIVLLMGGTAEGTDVYVQRQGNPLVYTVAAYAGGRLRPELSAFQADPPSDAGTPEPAAMPPGGPGGQQIPPELLEQLQRQMGAQGLGGPGGGGHAPHPGH